MIASVLALLLVIIARIAGPSDLIDQTQPKTVSYTSDMLANGRWVLPIERGVLPATKPPLYNWIAAPFVAAAGYSSEIAHKFPSVLALVGCWLLLTRVGNLLDPGSPGSPRALGWIAGLLFVVNYPMFKLGYLARPDMLLTFWLALGWIAATVLLLHGDEQTPARRTLWRATLWISVGLAGLTKGPAALVIMLYGVLGARVLTGSWRSAGRLGWSWGLPLALAIPGAWIALVWRVDAEHLRQVLWHDEIYGRVTGTGPEGARDGFLGWVRTLPNMPFYFMVRFLPWSIAAALGVMMLLRGGRAGCDPLTNWLRSSAWLIVLVLIVFSLSAGKRADYIALAYMPGALLAAWWLREGSPGFLRRWWVVPLAAFLTLAGLVIHNERDPLMPTRRFVNEINRFIIESRRCLDEEPMKVVFWHVGPSHVQALFGVSVRDSSTAALEAIQGMEPGESFWVVAGRPLSGQPFEVWMERIPGLETEIRVRSAPLPRARTWPGVMELHRVTRRADGEG